MTTAEIVIYCFYLSKFYKWQSSISWCSGYRPGDSHFY